MRFYNNNIVSLSRILAIILFCFTNNFNNVHAQSLEPRAYSNAPVGMNFLLVGYQYSGGALLFDPSLPVTDAFAKVDMGLIGYVRTLEVAGKSAKAGVLLPYASLSADGYYAGEYVSRNVKGMADPSFYFSMNLYGAPALSVKEFKGYQQKTIVGFTLKLSAPLGAYEDDKLLNIGTNRWSVKPEFGVSRAIGRWTLEGSAAVTLYTENSKFANNKSRKQDPVYSMQGHVIYSFKNHIWVAVSATYYMGGRTSIDGVSNNDLLQNWRTGFTLAIPVSRKHSIKVFGNSGVSTRTGTDYDALGIAWQYRWGEGF